MVSLKVCKKDHLQSSDLGSNYTKNIKCWEAGIYFNSAYPLPHCFLLSILELSLALLPQSFNTEYLSCSVFAVLGESLNDHKQSDPSVCCFNRQHYQLHAGFSCSCSVLTQRSKGHLLNRQSHFLHHLGFPQVSPASPEQARACWGLRSDEIAARGDLAKGHHLT